MVDSDLHWLTLTFDMHPLFFNVWSFGHIYSSLGFSASERVFSEFKVHLDVVGLQKKRHNNKYYDAF